MLLRGFFFYNSLLVIFGLGIALWALAAPQEFRQLWRRWRWRWLLLLGLVYWGASFLRTGNYYENLRTLELVLSVSLLCLLAVRRGDLGTALLGAGATSFFLGLALLPHGERVGEAVVDDYRLGNPITFGIPLALIFLLTIADGGKWLLLEKQRALRLAAGGLMGALLLLSGSRGSWVIVAAGLLVLLGGRRERVMVLAALLLLLPITAGLLATERGAALERVFERTFSSERTWAQSSSGRSDQWLLFPTAFWDAPLTGFGPGAGPGVYAQYSLRDPRGLSGAGNQIAWHALYLHLGIETGALGLLLLASLLLPLFLGSLVHWRLHRESTPLLGVVSFLVIGLSVTGLDAVSGLALGVGFLSKGRLKIRRSA
jgi:O-antigen ligase